MDYSPKKITEMLDNNSFHLKKKYGQNFIIDENIINSIISKSNINNETLVIEIGPGAGALTNKIAAIAKNVLCYEIDTTLEKVLSKTLSNYSNIEIKYEDFLSANIDNDIKKYNYSTISVIANLPYYITTPILVKIIESQIPVDKIIVMVQKEVGNRFRAMPGTKDYNSLTVYLNYYFDVKKILDVSRNVFIPKPNVDSIVVEFRKKERAYLKNETVFFNLVKDSFQQKRKTLKNNLKNYDLNKIDCVLKKHGYDLTVRAEQLSMDIFVEIANSL